MKVSPKRVLAKAVTALFKESKRMGVEFFCQPVVKINWAALGRWGTLVLLPAPCVVQIRYYSVEIESLPMPENAISTDSTPSSAGPKKKKGNYSKMKRQLLDAAAVLTVKKGFSATSMNDIAAQLGINKAALYYYFRSKEDIALEIEKLNLAYVKDVFEKAEESCTTGLEKLRFFFESYVKLMTSPIGAAGVQIVALPHSEEFAERSKLLFKEVDIKVRGYIIQGQLDGSIGKLDDKWSDYVLFGALHWIPRWYSEKRHQDPEEIASELFEVILQGLLPR